MTTFTTNFLWPKPAGTDAPDGPAQIGALADAIDSVVFAGIPYLARQTLSGSAASVTFSSIPSSLRSLRLRWTVRSDNAVNVQFISIQFNGNTGANYSYEVLQGNNTSASAINGAAQTTGVLGLMVGASASAGVFSCGAGDVIGWDNPHASSLGWVAVTQALGTGVANFFAGSGGGNAAVTGPYTSLTFLPQAGNFIAGSDFQIEGVRT